MTINGQNNIIKKLHYNDLIEFIENPTKQGYVFAGWYSNGEKFSFENAKMPNSNLVIEARYLKESEITFTKAIKIANKMFEDPTLVIKENEIWKQF